MSTLGGNFIIDPVRVWSVRSGPVRSGPDFAKPSAKIKRFPFHFACANACVM